MPEPGIPQRLPNQMFTRSQLRSAGGPDDPLYYLLESAAFDSVYTLHEDFADGLSDARWVSRGFTWQEDDFFGSVANVNDADVLEETDELPTDAYLFSRVKGWRANRRAVAMARFALSSVTAGKLEFGFASHVGDAGMGITDSVDRPTNEGVSDYGYFMFNPADSTTLVYAVARGLPNSGSATSGTPSFPLRAAPPKLTIDRFGVNTLMVLINETNEVKLYVNGQIVTATGSSGPRDAEDLGIWFHVGPNKDTGAPVVVLDYIHAWQERVPLTY